MPRKVGSGLERARKQPSKARNDFAILDRRVRVSQMYLQRVTVPEIASKLGVSRETVYADIAACREQWTSYAVANVDGIKGEELARLNDLEEQYRKGYAISLVPKKKRRREMDIETVKGVSKASGKGRLINDEIEEGGDPRFLAGIVDVIKLRLKILGIGVAHAAPVGRTGEGEIIPDESRVIDVPSVEITIDGDEPLV